MAKETEGKELNQDVSYEQEIRRHPLFRIMAVICLVILAVLIIATFVTGITGSKYFMGCLVLLIIVPGLMYVFLWIGRVISNHVNNR